MRVTMRFVAFSLAGILLLSPLAQAGMIDPAAIDASHLLPPPPAADSVKAQAELAELKAIAGRSAPDAVAAATRDALDERPDLFNAVIGFDVTTLPETAKLLSLVAKEVDGDSKSAKAFFHRDRPYVVDTSLKTCTPVKPGPAANSYPSGHATLAFSVGEVLAALMPEKAQAILQRAGDYAENRLVCGMHFRSDIVAGQQFGTIMALRLMQVPEFSAQMEKARAELRAAGH
jgi:acid phosphatase (class A)